MHGRKILGIDAGRVNVGVCLIDTSNPSRPVYWANECILKASKPKQEEIEQAIFSWITSERIKSLMNTADVIILESQIQKVYAVFNTYIRARYFAKVKVVAPVTIRAAFKLPATRKEKKKDTVDKVKRKIVLPVQKGKKDDLCDAYLLALWEVGPDAVHNFLQ